MTELDSFKLSRRTLAKGTAAAAAASQIVGIGTIGSVAAQDIPEVPRENTLILRWSGQAGRFVDQELWSEFLVGASHQNGLGILHEPLAFYSAFADETIPWLAESWEYNEDFTELTINLREGVTWSDGTPFSADDVAYTLNTLAELGPAVTWGVNVQTFVDKATAVDPKTVSVLMKIPAPRFMFFMTYKYDIGLPMVPKHIFDGQDWTTFKNFDIANGIPVTTGPGACHGPDAGKRKGKLRLDQRDEALKKEAFVPGKPDESTLVQRIFTTKDDDRMPPQESHKQLTARQKEILKRWVAQGGAYQQHWAYEPPIRPSIPYGEHAVDFLVRRRLTEIGLKPSAEADRRTLVRRLYSDLLGLPPTPAEVAAFEKDPSPEAYERLVDRVIGNPHYGERMALGWLDVVRYADTIGYHSDNPRNVWPYRDWVIRSFNENKRFDRFTLEQLAGDLLPDANRETRIGSAFNRLLLSTEEGGAQPKDYEARMLTDRVRAVGAAWLGQTTGCCQCHDHKFDPFTSRDFYSLGAFFSDVQEAILGRREDGMIVATPDQERKLAELDTAQAEARKRYEAVLPRLDAAQQQWEADVVAYDITLPELRSDSKDSDPEKKTAQQVAGLLKNPKRSPQEQQAVQNYFRARVNKLHISERDAVTTAERERREFYESLPKCLVSNRASEKRVVRILPRGNWMDESGEIVKAALPGFLPQPRFEGREPDRLDLARWLVSRENPLPARTVMNRLWKQFFGIGLSKVLDDLGAQGEPPANPALLDWLATEFMESGWDMKHMVRSIVTSATYRQVSTATPELISADPYNRELARQSAFRIEAELVRDTALAVSGLLVAKVGGPSVRPYQPDGYWENLNFPTRDYAADHGENQYRRGLYTWWQRSFLHPSLVAFDAPSREECTADRNRSNIPQQALVLLNDPTYVEAARVLAARIVGECRGSAEQRFSWAWQRTVQRDPRPEEVRIARELLEGHLATYRANPKAAEDLLKTGLTPVPEGLDKPELAAWTHVARVLLNLHETITRS